MYCLMMANYIIPVSYSNRIGNSICTELPCRSPNIRRVEFALTIIAPFADFNYTTGLILIVDDTVKHITLLLLVYLLSYLMVSTHRYLSFKNINIPRERRFHVIIGMILLLVLLATEPPITLFVVAIAYMFSGPFLAVRAHLLRKRKKLAKQEKSSS